MLQNGHLEDEEIGLLGLVGLARANVKVGTASSGGG